MLFMFYCMLVSHLASFTIVKRCGPKYWYYKFGSICPFLFAQNICSMSPKIFGRSFWYGLALYISCPSTSAEEVKLTKDQMSRHRTKQFLGEEARVKTGQMLIKKIWLTRSIRRSRSWRRWRRKRRGEMRGKMRALKSMRRRRLSLWPGRGRPPRGEWDD